MSGCDHAGSVEAYFAAIDDGRIEDAIDLLHPDVEWVHTQVWQEDTDNPDRTTTELVGKEAVAEVLRAYRDSEEASRDVVHRVTNTVSDEDICAFLGVVSGPDESFPMVGWVEFSDDRIVRYVAAPRR
jgi:ketosteroid isomerase-like protein